METPLLTTKQGSESLASEPEESYVLLYLWLLNRGALVPGGTGTDREGRL